MRQGEEKPCKQDNKKAKLENQSKKESDGK